MAQISKYPAATTSPPRQGPDLEHSLSPELFRALADPSRVSLLVRLARCCEPCCVSELALCCPIDLSVVSRHLAVLRRAGVLEAQKRGREVWYTVRTAELVQALRALADALEACCSASPGGGCATAIVANDRKETGSRAASTTKRARAPKPSQRSR